MDFCFMPKIDNRALRYTLNLRTKFLRGQCLRNISDKQLTASFCHSLLTHLSSWSEEQNHRVRRGVVIGNSHRAQNHSEITRIRHQIAKSARILVGGHSITQFGECNLGEFGAERGSQKKQRKYLFQFGSSPTNKCRVV